MIKIWVRVEALMKSLSLDRMTEDKLCRASNSAVCTNVEQQSSKSVPNKRKKVLHPVSVRLVGSTFVLLQSSILKAFNASRLADDLRRRVIY